jgi:hypothetical protein
VLVPGVLMPDLTRGVPARSVGQPYREIGHGRRIPTADDTPQPGDPGLAAGRAICFAATSLREVPLRPR